jgi:preprotein translocase SecE subunit
LYKSRSRCRSSSCFCSWRRRQAIGSKLRISSSNQSHGFPPLSLADLQHNSPSRHHLGRQLLPELRPCCCVVLTTGKSRKEECLVSEQNDEETCATAWEKAGTGQSIERIPKFLATVQQEMKLVHRPGWREVRSTTLVVIVFVLLFELYLYALDRILVPLDRWLFIR